MTLSTKARVRWLRNVGPPLLLITALSVVAGSSVYGVMSGDLLVPLALLGAAVSVGTLVVAEHFRLHTTEWLALSIVIFIAVGGIVADGVPTPAAYQTFFGGLVEGWANLLSSVPLVDLTGEFRVIPYTLAWLAATVGFVLFRHVPIPSVAAIGPMGAFGLGILFSIEARSVALAQGALLGILTITLGMYQAKEMGLESVEELGHTTVARRRKRLYGAGAILLFAAAAAPLVAPFAPGFDESNRYDLRDKLEPPWEPLDEPSPLAQIKGNYLDENRDEVAFTVRGENIPSRWRLATLASFDGSVWTVGDTALGGQAPFISIDGPTPASPTPGLEVQPAADTLDVEIGDLVGPWLPTPGIATDITLAGAGAPGRVRYNQYTYTAALPTGFGSGLQYSVTAIETREPGDDVLEKAPLAPGVGFDDESGADTIRTQAAEILGGKDPGWPQVIALRDYLIDNGSYSAKAEARPGHSWGRLQQFLSLDSEMFGFEEQYAAAAAVLAREAGLPARVVVGYTMTEEQVGQAEVEFKNIQSSAWIEIETVDYGWVPVDVTPDRDKEPSLENSGTRVEDVAAPNPPPPPPPPPDVQIDQDEEEEEEDEEDEVDEDDAGGGILGIAVLIGGVAAAPVGLLLLWAGLIGGLKAFRRKRRRSGPARQRIAGAWNETRDRLSEAGLSVGRNATINETAAVFDHAGPVDAPTKSVGAPVANLARTVDRAAFGPGEPTDDDAAVAWTECEHAIGSLKAEAAFVDRCRRTIDPRPLLRKDKIS